MTHDHATEGPAGGDTPDLRAREEPCELQRRARLVAASPMVQALLEAVDSHVAVLNGCRQIVSANRKFLALAASRDLGALLGKRPGEGLRCTHAADDPGGCGASEYCKGCGAFQALTNSMSSGQAQERECLLTLETEAGPVPAEFNVRASPVRVDGMPFTVLSMRDISAEKRRSALEQVFFHDLMNTIAGLSGWSERLGRGGEEADVRRAAERIQSLSDRLEREVAAHRTLLEAERGTLHASPAPTRAAELMRELQTVFSGHPAASGRTVTFEEPEEIAVETDSDLALRVLTNMVKNALEASADGEEVRVWCERLPAGDLASRAGLSEPRAMSKPSCAFFVQNALVIPQVIARRIFQRSFTTRGQPGRGLGTYGMRLLGERYLGGRVGFTSAAGEGTVFSFRLPLRG